uniref:Uncharacterized protein n=1 Tax=Sander lucioperca TaxID=283035 RepID=A0A8C9YEK4_SANLU
MLPWKCDAILSLVSGIEIGIYPVPRKLFMVKVVYIYDVTLPGLLSFCQKSRQMSSFTDVRHLPLSLCWKVWQSTNSVKKMHIKLLNMRHE